MLWVKIEVVSAEPILG
ncbi:hypothetical protein [Plasmodium yoelii yoelii]|uniref:Uncharacterized protein n=1 Tax=Plasmodium yoelii yoelii TaxID=73239 RepID=Q7RPN7_PLAYO|nr:hypothetical protein [Plasmodium yoelii yoelii]